MAKYGCACGCTISDNTDFQPHKARFIPDMQHEEFFNVLEQIVTPPDRYKNDASEVTHAIWRLGGSMFRDMFQCPQCGRIYIESKDGHLQCFQPESEKIDKQIFMGESDYTLHPSAFAQQNADKKVAQHWENRDKHFSARAQYEKALEQGERPAPPSGVPLSVKVFVQDEGWKNITEEYLKQQFPNIKTPDTAKQPDKESE